MKNVLLRDIVEASEGELLSGDPGLSLLTVSTDSRVIGENALFVPIVGANQDGHLFIEKALLNGAKASLTSDRSFYDSYTAAYPGHDRAFVLVNDTTEAFQKIGTMARTHLSLPAVGVTGSVGKTTTREMITAALSAEKKVYSTKKNYNNWLGVPITLCDMTDEDDIAVLELGLNVKGELELISSFTNLECAVLTNIGVAHIEFYGTQDEIAKAKYSITNGFWDSNPAGKMLFINGDDPYLMKYRDLTGYPYTIYGTTEDAAYRAQNIHTENGRFVFDFYRHGEFMFPVVLSVLGAHNVLNSLAAFAVADHYGIDLRKAAERISAFTGFTNRLQRYEANGYLIIDDTYNASPTSMKAGIDVLCDLDQKAENGRKYALLGDMFELGPNAPVYHYEVGEYVGTKRFDGLFLIGEHAKKIGEAVEKSEISIPVSYYDDKTVLTEALENILKPGDILYIKASNGMKLHAVTERLIEA